MPVRPRPVVADMLVTPRHVVADMLVRPRPVVAEMLVRPKPVLADQPGDACTAKMSQDCRDTNESGRDCSIWRLLMRWKPLMARLPPRRHQPTAPLFQQLHLAAAAFR